MDTRDLVIPIPITETETSRRRIDEVLYKAQERARARIATHQDVEGVVQEVEHRLAREGIRKIHWPRIRALYCPGSPYATRKQAQTWFVIERQNSSWALVRAWRHNADYIRDDIRITIPRGREADILCDVLKRCNMEVR